MHRTAACSVAILAALGLALTACSSAEPTDGTDPAAGTESASGTENQTEPVTLTFQALWDQPAAIEAYQGIVDDWNAANPDVQVEVIPAGWDGVYDKLITQFNGGSAPDIIHYEAASIGAFAADGYLADLSQYLPEELTADVPQGVWDSVTFDGQVAAVPVDMQSYMVFANKGLLDAAGVTVPTGDTMTWQEFMDIAAATTSDGVYGVGWGLKSPTATFMSLAPAFGGTYFDGTGDDVTIQVTDAELAVPELVHQMAYDDGSLDPVSLTQSGSEVLASFYGGTVAMTVQGSYQVANMANDAPEGMDWIVLPPLEGSQSAAQAANPQTLSVNIDSEHIEQAAEFLAFFAQPEHLASIALADALIPASTSAQAELATQTADQNGWDQVLASGTHLTEAPFLSVNAYAQWKDTVATPAFQKFLAGEIDAAGLQAELTGGWEQITR